MKRLKRLRLTDAIWHRIAIMRLGEDHLDGGGLGLSNSHIEIAKVELADEILQAIAAQTAAALERRDRRLRGLPRPQPAVVVELALRPKRRRG